jgi:hypothetical protein
MSYRVMVRSTQGIALVASTYGTYWEPRVYWSTWSNYDDEAEARAQRTEFQRGGIAATVIPEEDYPVFASAHRLV